MKIIGLIHRTIAAIARRGELKWRINCADMSYYENQMGPLLFLDQGDCTWNSVELQVFGYCVFHGDFETYWEALDRPPYLFLFFTPRLGNMEV